jgi:signal transduction histidine kinase
MVGFLGFAFKTDTEHDSIIRETLEVTGRQVTLALEITRLAAQVRVAVVLAERNRLGRETHDTRARTFAGLLVRLRALRKALKERAEDEVPVHIADSLGNREFRLSGAPPFRHGVAPKRAGGCKMHLSRWPVPNGPGPISVSVNCERALELSREHEANILRVAQDGVSNALKHAET